MRVTSPARSALLLVVLSSLACTATRDGVVVDPGVGAGTAAPIASVTIVASSARLVVGGVLQFGVQAVDTAGRRVTGRSVRWSSVNAGVAAVDSTGVVRGIAPGATTIEARVDGVLGSLRVDIEPPEVPEPMPTGATALRDGFDQYASVRQDGGSPALGGSYALRGSVQLVEGRTGGKALRFAYSAASDDNLIEKSFPPLTTVLVSYWYRTSPSADPTCGGRNPSGIKWLMMWRENGPRYTNGVGDLDNGGPGAPQTRNEFTTHDNSSVRQPAPFLQNIAKAPKFGTTNDGRWHRYTIKVATGNGGYEQIWIDGVLVLDNRAQAYDHAAEGIAMLQLPGLMVAGVAPGCDWTLDLDDLVVWTP